MKKYAISLFVITLLAGCTMGTHHEHWDNYTTTPLPKQDAQSSSQSTIIVAHPSDSHADKPINVYIDGEYFTTLRPGTFQGIHLCARTHTLSAAYTSGHTRYNEKNHGIRYTLLAGQTHYFSLGADENQRPVLQTISTEALRDTLQNTRRQDGPISRVSPANTCEPQAH